MHNKAKARSIIAVAISLSAAIGMCPAVVRAQDEVPALIADLQHGTPAARHLAASRLADLGAAVLGAADLASGAADALKAFTKLLGDDDTCVRYYAARCLGNLGDQARSAAPALAKALSDSQWIVARRAAVALAKIDPPALLEALRDGKVHRDALPKRRERDRFRPDEMAAALAPLLFDADESRRNLADAAFRNLGPDAARAADLAVARRAEPLQEAIVAGLLDRIVADDDYAPLIVERFFNVSEGRVRMAAVRGVARLRLGDAKSVRFLAAALLDERPDLRAAATDAIRLLAVVQPNVGEILLIDLKSQDPTHVSAALAAAESLGPGSDELLAAVLERFGHSNGDVAAAAMSAAHAIDGCGTRSVPQLAEMLKSPDRRLRLIAAEILGRFGASAGPALAALEAAANGDDQGLSAAAKASIEKIRADAANPQVASISFSDLEFEVPQGQTFDRAHLAESVCRLDGRQVRIKGFMLPSFEVQVATFLLVADNRLSSPGTEMRLGETVLVHTPQMEPLEYSVQPIEVEGRFSIVEYKDTDGKLLLVYQLHCAKLAE